MAIQKIQAGDKVKIISGKFRGTLGTVHEVRIKQKNGRLQKRVVVSGLPMMTKYQRSMKFANMPGQMFAIERTVDVSNVALVNGDGDTSKVKIAIEGGRRVRVYKKGQKRVEKVNIKKLREEEARKALEEEKKSKKEKQKKSKNKKD